MRKKTHGKWKILFTGAIILMLSAQIQLMAGASVPMKDVFSGDIKEDTAVYLEQGGSRYGYQSLQDREYYVQKQELYRNLQDACDRFTEGDRDAWNKTVNGETVYVAGYLAVHGLDKEDVAETYAAFRYDNPQYFWLPSGFLYSTSYMCVLTYGEYRLPSDREEALENILQTLYADYGVVACLPGKESEVANRLYRILLQDASYPVLESHAGRDAWHSVAGVLAGDGAVCEGYAKTLQLLLNLSGIPSVYVVGDAGGTRHAWNMACMEDGQWYLLDATWDDSAGSMGYFLSGSDGVHVADTPGQSGIGYFYQLPELSDEKYLR